MPPASDGYWLEEAYLVHVHVPAEDVDAVLGAVIAAVGLPYGGYDGVALVDAAGQEQFRDPGDSAPTDTADRVATSRVSFSLPRVPEELRAALTAVRAAHSYEEPVIYVREVLRSRSTRRQDVPLGRRLWTRAKQKLARALQRS
jgi:hypothetical protein